VIDSSQLPVIGDEVFALIGRDCVPGGSRENLKTAGAFTDLAGVDPARRILAADAQTSGGLLLCVRPGRWAAVRDILKQHRTPCAALVGEIVRSRKPRIRLR
jgi:selenide,water dikinase